MLKESEIENFSKVCGHEGLVKFLNMDKSDLIRLLFSEMHLKNVAFSFLVDHHMYDMYHLYLHGEKWKQQ